MGEVYFKSFLLYITEKHLIDAHERVYLNSPFDFTVTRVPNIGWKKTTGC